jgi:hypothetical protein
MHTRADHFGRLFPVAQIASKGDQRERPSRFPQFCPGRYFSVCPGSHQQEGAESKGEQGDDNHGNSHYRREAYYHYLNNTEPQPLLRNSQL